MNETSNEVNKDELKKRIDDLEKRVQFIENKMHRAKVIKIVTYVLYIFMTIGIVLFAYFYYKNIYGSIIGMF